RKESPTQKASHAVLQVGSMEIWGKAARGSSIPAVKAYRHQLPAGDRGIEFSTPVLETRGTGTPFLAYWYENSPGVVPRNPDYVAISICCIENRQP
ncbi:MAG TPA: RHS repeat-associated core domain-containing protein, partial [Alphaproteobacteria bacterium]|nr:RHS repeat-associated core domain-containing protein [Alphaproteobacteria bacterium]